jgi:GrpB-like predicted nucleotidyltransferase (UPF0157 family)
MRSSLVEHKLRGAIHGGVHHVGRTSVPGIAAKPIIDIMVDVDGLQRASACIELLAGIQRIWEPRPGHEPTLTAARFQRVGANSRRAAGGSLAQSIQGPAPGPVL